MPRERLLSELKRMRQRELEATLAQLKPEEREQVLALIRLAEPAQPILSFETLVGLSPWLLKAADRAQAGENDGAASMTLAARAALAEAFGKLAGAQTPSEGQTKAEPRWKSLLTRKKLRPT
jgi:hypothetical protein